MNKILDTIHHTAIQVKDIATAVIWYNSLRVLDFLNILILQNFFKSWVFSNHIRKIWNL